MGTRPERGDGDPNIGVLAARLLFAVQAELFSKLAEEGFDDLQPRHGTVLAHLDRNGTRATELSHRSGQHKQVVGTIVDELEELGYVVRRPDPADRRAKLVCPTERCLAEMHAATRIMAAIQERHARRIGRQDYARFKAAFADITEHQRLRQPR